MRAAKIRREKPKLCRVYGVKRAVFLHNAGKRLRRQPVGVKNLTAMAGGVRLFCHRTAEFCIAAFCLGWPHFSCKRHKISSNCLIFVGKGASCIATLRRAAEEFSVDSEAFSVFC